MGATLIITDTPETASALSFYLPHNPFVYVESKANDDHPIRFLARLRAVGLAERFGALSSATRRARIAQPIRPRRTSYKNFATVTPIDDPPLPDFDKSWNIWNCQNFIGSGSQAPGDAQTDAHARIRRAAEIKSGEF